MQEKLIEVTERQAILNQLDAIKKNLSTSRNLNDAKMRVDWLLEFLKELEQSENNQILH